MVLYKIFRLPKKAIPKSTEIVQAFSQVDIKLIKSISKLTGCAFREVVSSTLLSALRRFMLETKSATNLPDSMAVGVALPALYFKRSFDLVANRG